MVKKCDKCKGKLMLRAYLLKPSNVWVHRCDICVAKEELGLNGMENKIFSK